MIRHLFSHLGKPQRFTNLNNVTSAVSTSKCELLGNSLAKLARVSNLVCG